MDDHVPEGPGAVEFRHLLQHPIHVAGPVPQPFEIPTDPVAAGGKLCLRDPAPLDRPQIVPCHEVMNQIVAKPHQVAQFRCGSGMILLGQTQPQGDPDLRAAFRRAGAVPVRHLARLVGDRDRAKQFPDQRSQRLTGQPLDPDRAGRP